MCQKESWGAIFATEEAMHSTQRGQPPSPLESTSAPRDRARLLASRAPHSGDWMLAPPVTALGLRLSDEEVRIAVGLRLGTTLCEPHLCHHCRETVDAKGLHGLVCRSGNGKHLRHSMINDVVWRSWAELKSLHKKNFSVYQETTESGQMVSQSFLGSADYA